MRGNICIAVCFSLAAAAFAAVAETAGLGDRLDRVKAVADGICRIDNAVMVTRADPEGKDPLAQWAAMQKDDSRAEGAFVRVDFSLVPEAGSDIRCRAALPLPGKWDGRMWGQGNSGHAGCLPGITPYVAAGTAAVTTDLGTGAITDGGKSNSKIWPKNVQRDYNWRATQLMTVYGKRIVKAFYGRQCDRAYFCGGSCGGRQAMCEAIRFPDDYDGIISVLPANNSAATEIAVWNLWRQTHDADGKPLFTTDEMRAVSDAAVAFRAESDPAPYAGKFLADARFSESDVDGFLALAAKKCPSLAVGDKIARLKAVHMPLVHDGKCYFNGFAPGSYLGKNMSWMGLINFRSYLQEHGITYRRWKDIGWKEIDGFLKEYAPEFNACSPDLSAFAAHGGKLIMTAGWEDQTVPPAPIVDYYERVCRKDGGIEKTKAYFRMFCIPGCAHGGGKGRAMTASPGGKMMRELLVGWREKGVAPNSITVSAGQGVGSMPVAPYPGLFVKDSSGRWSVRMTERGVTPISDVCLETLLEVGR